MYVDILTLAHLSARPAHGYEIKKAVERTLGRRFALNNNLLYPALKRFEDLGAVLCTVEHQEGRPDRRVYHLTERGVEVLQGLLHDFSADLARDETEFLVRVAFFYLLDRPARWDILRTRESVLREHLAHVDRVLPEAERADQRDAARVIAFLTQQIQHELAWIAGLRREVAEERS